jgi:hypothetical protein
LAGIDLAGNESILEPQNLREDFMPFWNGVFMLRFMLERLNLLIIFGRPCII